MRFSILILFALAATAEGASITTAPTVMTRGSAPGSIIGLGNANTNTSTATNSVISGGATNRIESIWSVINGGKHNQIMGGLFADRASVIGGGEDSYITNSSAHSVIMGGLSNVIDGARYAVVGGWRQRIYAISSQGASNAAVLSGWQNTNSVKNSVICGGWQNSIQYTNNLLAADNDNDFNAIVGGWDNTIRGAYGSFIGGGYTNTIYNVSNQKMSSSFIGAGIDNRIGDQAFYSGIVDGVDCIIAGTAARSFIGGGSLNACVPINGENAMVICGGIQNTNSGCAQGFIGAGQLNWLNGGNDSAILGGRQNYLTGNTGAQFIIGRNLTNDWLNGGSDDRLDMGFAQSTKTMVDISGLTTLGSLTVAVTNKTTTYTALVSDHIVLCNATAAAFTVTLPAASARKGLVLHIKKTDASANAVTVSRAGADTIQGATTVSLATQYTACNLYSDGTSTWYKYAPNQ